MTAFRHIPAMLAETIEWLDCRPGKIVVDGTVGGAGHAGAIADRILPDGLLIGIDRDDAAIAHAARVLAPHGAGVHLIRDTYANLGNILQAMGLAGVDGILLDLGVSLYQLEASGRGFSFQTDEPLDMRMDSTMETTAADMVNRLSEVRLREIFRRYGEERWAGRIARRIVWQRARRRITTTGELSDLIRRAVPAPAAPSRRIHPATRVFMALRIAVNRELEQLESFMAHFCDWLKPGGRFCALSFHSLEDRIVKHGLREAATACTCPPGLPRCVCNGKARIRVLTPKPLRPSASEIDANPMARSTRLRAAERL